MKRLLLIATALFCLGAPLAAANVAAAYDPLDAACNADDTGNVNVQNESSACSVDPSKDPIAGPDGILKKVALLLGVLGGVVAVIMIIVSGFRYITAAGDAQKAAGARQAIVGAVIGLVIMAASTSIVIFVISGL